MLVYNTARIISIVAVTATYVVTTALTYSA